MAGDVESVMLGKLDGEQNNLRDLEEGLPVRNMALEFKVLPKLQLQKATRTVNWMGL
jgi:hypothetical protein